MTVCRSTTIAVPLHLEAAKFCREIDGDLTIEPEFPSLDASALPYLTRVRGNVRSLSPYGLPAAQSITLPALQIVDGSVNFSLFANLTKLSLPRLQSAQDLWIVNSPKLEHISLPALTTVRGALGLSNLPSLARLDIGVLQTVGGEMSLGTLCELPWAQVSRINTFGATQTVGGIGCCRSTDRYACETSPCTCQ